MVKFYHSISPDLQQWALRQEIFFIASAPLNGKHINCSPKGQPSATLTIFHGNFEGYLDATGSGIETISHVYENGRATGRVIEVDHPEYETWLKRMGKAEYPSMRAIILFYVFKAQTSCGFAVPLLSQRIDPLRPDEGIRGWFDQRKTLENLAKKGIPCPKEMAEYRVKMNSKSLDDLPGLRLALKTSGKSISYAESRARLRTILRQWEVMLLGATLALLAVALLQYSTKLLRGHMPVKLHPA